MRLADGAASPAEIREAYNTGVAPWAFFSLLKEEEFASQHRELLVAWAEFWRDVGAEPLNKPLAVFLLLQLNATGQRIRLLGAFGTGQIDCFLFYNPVGVIYPAVPPGQDAEPKKRNTAHTMHLAENTNLFSTENRRADTKVQMFSS
jgi:hypothetical protein